MVGTKDYLVSNIKMTYVCYVLGENNIRHLKFRNRLISHKLTYKIKTFK